MLTLRYKVLREPWGLDFLQPDLRNEQGDAFITYREEGRIVGCCILTRQSPEVVKLRRMAVHPDRRGIGVGAKLPAFAEQYANEQGYATMVLHARKTAENFYAKYGYSADGDVFIEVGMPHVLMRKQML